MVNLKVKIGDRLRMKAISVALGVPMGFLSGLWKFMDGKKTLFGAVIAVVSYLAAGVPLVSPLCGENASCVSHVATAAGVLLAVVGVLHKAYKFFYKEEPKE